MLTELLRERPGLEATLVDLPGTVARADGPFATVGQSFFDPLPAGADLYLLRSVLNDWPDEETDAILRNVARRDARAQPADRDRRRRRRRRAAAAGDRDGAAGRAHRLAGGLPGRAARRASRCSRPVRSPRETSSSNVRGGTMAYDERLADAISDLIHARPGVSRRRCSAASAG